MTNLKIYFYEIHILTKEIFLYKHHYTKLKFLELKQEKLKLNKIVSICIPTSQKRKLFIHEKPLRIMEESYKLLFKYLYID